MYLVTGNEYLKWNDYGTTGIREQHSEPRLWENVGTIDEAVEMATRYVGSESCSFGGDMFRCHIEYLEASVVEWNVDDDGFEYAEEEPAFTVNNITNEAEEAFRGGMAAYRRWDDYEDD